MLELRQLRYFAAVAELGSIAKAADALHMTQPALSRQLSRLERQIGFTLVERKHRGSSLTPAGRGLKAHLPLIAHQIERIPDVLTAAEEGAHLLHLGVPPGIPYDWFNAIAESLTKGNEQIVLSLFEGTSDQQMQMLQEDVLDVGLVHTQPANLPHRQVMSQRLGCAFLSEDRIPARDELALRDLSGLRVMAQSSPAEQLELRAGSAWQGAEVTWMFRNYSHHGQLIARASRADAVLVTHATAGKDFAKLTWIPLAENEPLGRLTTWACWRQPAPRHLDFCLAVMLDATPT